MWGSHPGARAPGRELPALRAYCAVTDATSRAKGDYKKSHVPKWWRSLRYVHLSHRFASGESVGILADDVQIVFTGLHKFWLPT
ncbi:hypothetical protein LF1_47700 [Rubripirellula obstinata]|uniref:Uncharacterized protein n=1 Tax=Rubripirellula obstinata TaxID=406547 RepID=A0A5B1CMB7_9BACT|nr:hypothetical protein LF1_47700 [Rubripirellula obstinata]